MGWLIAATIVFLLLCIPLGISAVYDGNGGSVYVIASVFKFLVYPRPKDPDRPAKEKVKKKETGGEAKKQTTKNKGAISDFYPFIKLVLDFLCDFKRKLRVDHFQLYITLAGGDPADLALSYGKACASVGTFLPALNQFLIIKKQDVNVSCDFEGSNTTVEGRLDLTLTVGRLLSMVLRHGVKVIKEYFNFRKKRNGGIV